MNAPHLKNIIGNRIRLDDKDKGEIDAWSMKHNSTWATSFTKAKPHKEFNFKKIKPH